MCDTVEQQGVKAGVAQHDFQSRTGGRIAGKGGVDFVAQVFKKHRGHYVMLVADATQRHRAASVEPEPAYNCPTNAIKKWRASIAPTAAIVRRGSSGMSSVDHA